MKKPIVPFGVRLTPDLRQWLAARAAENQRSMNGELIKILKQAREAELQEPAQ